MCVETERLLLQPLEGARSTLGSRAGALRSAGSAASHAALTRARAGPRRRAATACRRTTCRRPSSWSSSRARPRCRTRPRTRTSSRRRRRPRRRRRRTSSRRAPGRRLPENSASGAGLPAALCCLASAWSSERPGGGPAPGPAGLRGDGHAGRSVTGASPAARTRRGLGA